MQFQKSASRNTLVCVEDEKKTNKTKIKMLSIFRDNNADPNKTTARLYLLLTLNNTLVYIRYF